MIGNVLSYRAPGLHVERSGEWSPEGPGCLLIKYIFNSSFNTYAPFLCHPGIQDSCRSPRLSKIACSIKTVDGASGFVGTRRPNRWVRRSMRPRQSSMRLSRTSGRGTKHFARGQGQDRAGKHREAAAWLAAWTVCSERATHHRRARGLGSTASAASRGRRQCASGPATRC